MKTKLASLFAGLLLCSLPTGLLAADPQPAATPSPGQNGGCHCCHHHHHHHHHHHPAATPSPTP